MNNEIGRLAQGRLSNKLPGINTLQFILFDKIPQRKKERHDICENSSR